MNHSLPHVLHIASGDQWAGAEVQLFTLVKMLHNKLNVPVSVALLNHGELEQKLQASGIKVTVLDESKMNGFQILRNLVRIVKELQPDIVHTHRIKENILGSISASLGGVPSLRTVHGAPEYRPAWWQLPKRLIVFLDRLCGRFLQRRIIAVTDDLANILQREFPQEVIRVVENGIDANEINHYKIIHPPDKIHISTTLKIGLAGRLVPIKRVDLFILTAQYIANHYAELNVSFHIFGDGPLRSDLESLCKCTNTDAIVHFEGHCNDINLKLQEINVLLMTSDHEGLPMILLEAMALGTPVIAHAVGGIPKLLDQGVCGVLVYDHSAAGYAHAIYHLLKSPDIRDSLNNKSLEYIKTHYSATGNAKGYLSVYRNIDT